jgi:hypothetical protein
MSMTESKRASTFRESANSLFYSGSYSMRCYFMRGGHIEAVEELTGLSDEEAIAKAHALFSERKHTFEGFEVWNRTRVLLRHPEPAVQANPGVWPMHRALGNAMASLRPKDGPSPRFKPSPKD